MTRIIVNKDLMVFNFKHLQIIREFISVKIIKYRLKKIKKSFFFNYLTISLLNKNLTIRIQ